MIFLRIEKYEGLQSHTHLKGLAMACHKKIGPPIFDPPGPNISKYLDPPDNLFQFC